MTDPIAPLISLLGAPGAACEGDACLPALTDEPDVPTTPGSPDQQDESIPASSAR